jgi:uncharacterized membrane protein YphA (DoxX/SURF4 family)
VWVSTAARFGLAVVWLWAGWAKVADPAAAARAVRAYEVLPEVLVKPLAWGLPFVELALGIVLLLGIANRTAAIASLVLLAVFIAGIAQAWARGLQIACGCFGGGGSSATAGWRSYGIEIARDVLFVVGAVWLAFRPVTRYQRGGK